MGTPSSTSTFDRITRLLARCSPEGVATLCMAEGHRRQSAEAQREFERELAALYPEFGLPHPGRRWEA